MKNLKTFEKFKNDEREQFEIDYKKVKDTIDSIDKKEQIETASKMIDNFSKKYKEIYYPGFIGDRTRDLRNSLKNKEI